MQTPVIDTFQPYYAGRDTDSARLKIRGRKGDKIATMKIDHEEKPETETSKRAA